MVNFERSHMTNNQLDTTKALGSELDSSVQQNRDDELSVNEPSEQQMNKKRKTVGISGPASKLSRSQSVDSRTTRSSGKSIYKIEIFLTKKINKISFDYFPKCIARRQSIESATLPIIPEKIDRKKRDSRRSMAITASNEAATDVSIFKNTDREIHSKNTLYNSLCLYCNSTEVFLVKHYAKQHSEHELPISRPSPDMAERLLSQTEMFQMKMGKIEGICYFCAEKKTMPKRHWTQHYISHTGEQMFTCSTCNETMKRKNDHKNCSGEAINISKWNLSDATLVGFMCRECNYLKIRSSAMEKHLKDEHGYQSIDSDRMCERVTLIPDLSPVQSKIPAKYGYVEISMRYKCTICQTTVKDDEQFTKHFDNEHKDCNQYDCMCGETIKKQNDLSGDAVSNHLLMHRTELYQCIDCNDVYLNRTNVRNHILNAHPSGNIKYRHVCRNPERPSIISETNVEFFKCKLCQQKVEGTFTKIIEHFHSKHGTNDVNATAFLSKKWTLFAEKPNAIVTKYASGFLFHVKI